jgi:hypothetical protein
MRQTESFITVWNRATGHSLLVVCGRAYISLGPPSRLVVVRCEMRRYRRYQRDRYANSTLPLADSRCHAVAQPTCPGAIVLITGDRGIGAFFSFSSIMLTCSGSASSVINKRIRPS